LRILLLADTHLGFDAPRRPRSRRRRRGPAFWAAYRRALEPARRGLVDLVVHGGDLLYRSKVPAGLTERALRPLKELADAGVPVVLVPGNHERSAIPHPLLARHPGLLIFHRPQTFVLRRAGLRIALAGFAHQRQVRRSFRRQLAATGWQQQPADVRLLCLHQAVEGARLGPRDFTFTGGDDVIRAAELPAGFAAVLAGHIHRHQVLDRAPDGRRLACPVFYPGATERTSAAERYETKGCIQLQLSAAPGTPGRISAWRFQALEPRAPTGPSRCTPQSPALPGVGL
jgi:DNA repair exonuclease SbcCD nuclease subunit